MSGCGCGRCEQKRATAREWVRDFYKGASLEELEDRRAAHRRWIRDKQDRKARKFLSQFSPEDQDYIARSFGLELKN